MKINLTIIQEPVKKDSHTVTGKINGKPVVVYRELNNWTPELVIVVDGVMVHNHEASEEDKAAFRDLMARTYDEADKNRQWKREDIQPIVEQLFTLPKKGGKNP